MTARFRSTDRWLLLVVLLLALILRVWRLDAQSLWYDEAVTAQVATQGIADLTRWTANDIQPPLYYYLVAGWIRLVGQGEWALRFPSVFFGTLTVALLWALARRLFGRDAVGRSAALIAALLAAVSPLYVYYSQEARMYTLLTLTGALAGYTLLRAAAGDVANQQMANQQMANQQMANQQIGKSASHRSQIANHTTRWWSVFVLASSAMLYTHYFGVFLLLAYALCLGGMLAAMLGHATTRIIARQGLTHAVLAGLATVLLYLPWLPTMLNRYRVDRSYWQGSLKLDEALRHVAISFTSGAPEMMLEPQAVRLLPWFGVVLGIAFLALGWYHGAKGSGKAWICLPVVLVVPVITVLGLASRTPKFNARYLMMATPAYLLILAGGVGALLERREPELGDWGPRRQDRTSRTMHHASRIIYALRFVAAIFLVGLLVVFSLISVHNWFADPAFTKAQWRDLATTVRAGIGADETVLLVSGHAFPAWDYYAPDIPRTRLPDIDILDVEAVLGFDVGASLTRALRNKSGAWVVLWQEEAVDPVGFVPYFLDRAGEELPVDRAFWHVGLRHWRLRPDATYSEEPRPAHADGVNYAHRIALLGWDDPVDGQLTVYWRALNPMRRDYRVSLILEDDAAVEVGRWDGRPAGYDPAAGYTYPTFRWSPGQVLLGRYPLPLSDNAPDGPYYVTLALYDDIDPAGLDIMDVADNPAGKRIRLGPMSAIRSLSGGYPCG